ncbi:MAG: hypothetical protein JNK05_14090 [Myxococcales bacterium]|nr:hypothetical protein [Myxococcales bacterium]
MGRGFAALFAAVVFIAGQTASAQTTVEANVAVQAEVPAVAQPVQPAQPMQPAQPAPLGAQAEANAWRAATQDNENTTLRLVALFGTNFGATAVGYALWITPLVLHLTSYNRSISAGNLAMIITGATVSVFAPPIAVTLVGNAMGGRGSFALAFLANLFGPLVPAVGSFGAAAFAYEWSSRETKRREAAERAFSLRPTSNFSLALAPTPNGLSLGGTF